MRCSRSAAMRSNSGACERPAGSGGDSASTCCTSASVRNSRSRLALKTISSMRSAISGGCVGTVSRRLGLICTSTRSWLALCATSGSSEGLAR